MKDMLLQCLFILHARQAVMTASPRLHINDETQAEVRPLPSHCQGTVVRHSDTDVAFGVEYLHFLPRFLN